MNLSFKDEGFQTISNNPSVAVKRSHSYVDDVTKKNRMEEGKNSSKLNISSAKQNVTGMGIL